MNVMNYTTRNVLTVQPSDPIDRAITVMEERGVHHLVVVQNGACVGMLSDRDVLLSTGWMFAIERQTGETVGGVPQVVGPTRVEQIMTRPAVSLNEAGSAREAAQLMSERKIGALPILQNGELIGLVTEGDLLRWLDALAFGSFAAERALMRPVSEWMPLRLVCVEPDVPLEDVVDTFRRFRIRHLPVATGRTLMGMISDRDVRRALGWESVRDAQAQAACRPSLNGTPRKACDVMQRQVRTTPASDPLRSALRKMLEARVHSMPVMIGDQLTGIITATDFTKAIARDELL